MELKEVFGPVLNFIKNLQKKDKEPASKQAAKDRLKLVLMQDRASVSPDFFEMMKKEIIDVIKRYIEIDEESLEVELTRGLEAGLEGPALYANIPIKNVKPVGPKKDDDEDGEDTENGDEKTAMTEEEAERAAESILRNLEFMSNKEENIVVDEIKSEEVIEETENDEEFVSEKTEQEEQKEKQKEEPKEEPKENEEKKSVTKAKSKTKSESKTETKTKTRKTTSTATKKKATTKKKE